MNFDDDFVNLRVDFNRDYSKVKLYGFVKHSGGYKQIIMIAPNPMDRMTNYSGSGLPFPCSSIAFENTPNKIEIGTSGTIDAVFLYPNSFYAQNGRDKVVSSIFFEMITVYGKTIVKQYELVDKCVVRSLANRSARKGPEFYGAKDYILPVDTAENVMREYAKAKIEHDIG